MFNNHYMTKFSENEGRVPAAGSKRALFGAWTGRQWKCCPRSGKRRQAGSGGSVIAVRPPGGAIGGGVSPAGARHS